MVHTTFDIATEDGAAGAHAFYPSTMSAWPGVLFYMDGLGIRPNLFVMAERLASHGYYVLLPDLYYRSGPYEPINAGAAFADGPERERLMKLFQSINNTLVMRDTVAFLDFLSRQPQVTIGPLGCVGYCMGGSCAVSAAGSFPERVAAAAAAHPA